jgi:hypothetical protein
MIQKSMPSGFDPTGVQWLPEKDHAQTKTRAFSSEVDTGSREENASKHETRAPLRFNRNGKALERDPEKFVQLLSEKDHAPGQYWIESASGLLPHRRDRHEARSISRVPTFCGSVFGATYAGSGELPMSGCAAPPLSARSPRGHQRGCA